MRYESKSKIWFWGWCQAADGVKWMMNWSQIWHWCTRDGESVRSQSEINLEERRESGSGFTCTHRRLSPRKVRRLIALSPVCWQAGRVKSGATREPALYESPQNIHMMTRMSGSPLRTTWDPKGPERGLARSRRERTRDWRASARSWVLKKWDNAN